MKKLSRQDLYSLEQYAELRDSFRKQVMEHKQKRRLQLGPHATLYFEDRLTMQYQVQEMLRIEKIFAAQGIMDELEAYNPLIPDGNNWKATFMVEFPDVDLRRAKLKELVGIEDCVWLQIGGQERITPIADEDLPREDAEKTSAVHFLKFDLQPAQVAAAKEGAELAAGIDHRGYRVEVRPVPDSVRRSLVDDLD